MTQSHGWGHSAPALAKAKPHPICLIDAPSLNYELITIFKKHDSILF